MIKRDKRNIGKLVTHIDPNHPYYNRIGKIICFRGNNTPRDPWVQVFFEGSLGNIPIMGSRLKYMPKGEVMERKYVKCEICGKKHQYNAKVKVECNGKTLEVEELRSPCFTELSNRACGIVSKLIRGK